LADIHRKSLGKLPETIVTLAVKSDARKICRAEDSFCRRCKDLRFPLSAYGPGGGRVYSLVAQVSFTPLDVDMGRLARGEWDALTDRFRLWFIPRIEGRDDKPMFHLSVRKFDKDAGVLSFMHVVPNLGGTLREGESEQHFTVGILCNDDVRARAVLGSMLDMPPAFRRRNEIALVEKRWRTDPQAVMFFLANVHSAMSGSGSSGRTISLHAEGKPSLDMLAAMKETMGSWWEEPRSG
jgi:hypothetical protein